MNNTTILTIVTAVFALTAMPLSAQANDTNANPPNTNKTAQSATPMSDGEILKVDRGNKKITIRHGVIKNLEMPPMTMTFHCKNPELLVRVKAGDKIRFQAEKIGGAFTVTHIENLK